MDAFRLVLTVVVMIGVVVAILLFEKRRAQRIEHDTREAARADQAASTTDPDAEATGVEIGSTDGEGSTFEPEEDPEGHSG